MPGLDGLAKEMPPETETTVRIKSTKTAGKEFNEACCTVPH
jgi:hypothetical protein